MLRCLVRVREDPCQESLSCLDVDVLVVDFQCHFVGDGDPENVRVRVGHKFVVDLARRAPSRRQSDALSNTLVEILRGRTSESNINILRT